MLRKGKKEFSEERLIERSRNVDPGEEDKNKAADISDVGV
jgi:hypothetical protein